MSLTFWILLLISFFIFTYFMKIFFKAKTWYFASMVRSIKAVRILDFLEKYKVWDFIAESGIYLGFGFLAILFFYKKKKNKKIFFWQIFIFFVSLFFSFISYTNLGLTNAIIVFFIVNLFGLAGFSLYILGYYSYKILLNYFLGKNSCPGIAPVIPGLKLKSIPFYIPFVEGWLALFTIMVVHELAHGVLARKIKVKVKSFGLLLLGFFPIGAFTEPDEKQLDKAKAENQLKVYAAGPSINFYFTLLFLILSFLLGLVANPYLTKINSQIIDGVYIKTTDFTGLCNDGILSKNKGLVKDYTKVLAINNVKVNDLNDFFVITKNIDKTKPLTFTLLDKNKTYDLNLVFNEDGKLGIMLKQEQKDVALPFKFLFLRFVFSVMHWIWLLSLMVAIFNFLPTAPFDGGKMTQIILSEFIFRNRKISERRKLIARIFGYLLLLFLIINLLPWFF